MQVFGCTDFSQKSVHFRQKSVHFSQNSVHFSQKKVRKINPQSAPPRTTTSNATIKLFRGLTSAQAPLAATVPRWRPVTPAQCQKTHFFRVRKSHTMYIFFRVLVFLALSKKTRFPKNRPPLPPSSFLSSLKFCEVAARP